MRETPDIETSSEDYARRFAGPVGEFFLRVQEKLCLELLRPWRGCRVLDVGGGHAQLAVPLAAAGYEVTVLGSDNSCSQRLSHLISASSVSPAKINFIAGDILSLPFPHRAYDVVVSLRLVSHVRRWRLLIHELTRVARGAVLIDYPATISVNLAAPLLFRLKKQVERNTRPFLCFTRGDISRAFRGNGYLVSATRPEFFLPMALYRAVKSVPFVERSENLFELLGLTAWCGSPVLALAKPESCR